MNIPELKTTIGGKMIKTAVIENGVVVKEYDYGKGHSNTIVDMGLEYLLKRSTGVANEKGDYLFGGISSTSYRGLLRGCRRGSGSTATTVDMTTLEAQIGNTTTTVLAGDPHTGTRYDRENSTIYMRITHDHEIETEDRNINEIGYFGIRNTTIVPMFSRIVLPSTVTVATGQQLRTTYELALQIGPTEVTACASNLVSGWDTTGSYRFCGYMPETSTTYGSLRNSFIPVIDTNGNSLSPYGEGNISTSYPPRGSLYAWYDNTMMSVFHITDTCNFDTEWYVSGSDLTGNYYVYGNIASTITVSPSATTSGTVTLTSDAYVDGTLYRDLVLTCEANWPGFDVTIYGINLFGLKYKFDTPQTKSTIQRLTLRYRISFARA